MSLEVWLPEGIHEEHKITVSNGETKQLLAFPYKWFFIDVFNEGPDAVKIMKNAESLASAITLEENDGREFDAKHPKFWQVVAHAEAGKTATVKIVTER